MKTNTNPASPIFITDHFFDLHKFMRLAGENNHVMLVTSEAFVTYTPGILQELGHEVAQGNNEGIRKALHKLKSSTAMFAVERLTFEMSGLDKCDFMDADVLQYRVRVIVEHVERLVLEVRMFVMTMAITSSEKL